MKKMKLKSIQVIILCFLFSGVFVLPGCFPAKNSSPPSPSPAGKPLIINPVDGGQMVLIPAGEFVMGEKPETSEWSDNGISHNDNPDQWKRPEKTVFLDDYYIYKYEVTNGQFRKFAESTGYSPDGNWEKWVTSGTDDYPVVMVSWNDAEAYCRWAGVKLPTEAQWEKAARGTGGRIYPWGNQWDSSFCNNKNTPYEITKDRARLLFEKAGIMPVGSFPKDASPYGVMDMAGNVSEWTADWFFEDEEYWNKTLKNPPGYDRGEDKVLRGGSFYKDIESCRLSFVEDNLPESNDTDYGFRCVWTPDMPLPSASGTVPALRKTPEAGAPWTQSPSKPEASLVESPSPFKINTIDGGEMILIPAGSFMMGGAEGDREARLEEKPARSVYLDDYYIYRNEVTYDQFAVFVGKTGYKSEGTWRDYYDKSGRILKNHPVVYVTWNDALAYCRWAGGDLPTEAQWEKAARGINGYVFSWGNRWDPDKANVLETGDPKMLALRYIYYDNLGTVPVGVFEGDKSCYGVMDMTGNVIEWCRDWYDPQYYKKGPLENPAGPETGTQRVMRGGGWGQDMRICRLTYRDRARPLDTDGDFGFRCMVEIKK